MKRIKNLKDVQEQLIHESVREEVDEELSILDVWILLAGHKKIILAFLALFTLGGVFIASQKPVLYTYTASIEIGGSTKPVESMETVRSKLENVFIPMAMREHQKKYSHEKKLSLNVKLWDKSNLVMLESMGSESEEEFYVTFMQMVADKMVNDHEPRNGVMKNAILAERAIAERKLSALEDSRKFLKSEVLRLDKSNELLKKQIEKTNEIFKNMRDQRSKAVKYLKDESSAMTLLMIDSQVLEGRKHLEGLEEELFVNNERKRDQLKKDIADNQRFMYDQHDMVNKIDAKIAGLSETRTIAAPIKSFDPLPRKRGQTVVVTALLGLLFGMMFVFFLEIHKKARLLKNTN